jgi:hypothetical protein
MPNRVDDEIIAYLRDHSEARLAALDAAFVEETFHVPVSKPVKKLHVGRYDVPVICVRTEAGNGAVPAFTTVEHLLKWKPEGCLYTSITGRSLIAMAEGMPAISEILVNPNDIPRGRIPRSDFKRMLELHQGRSGT